MRGRLLLSLALCLCSSLHTAPGNGGHDRKELCSGEYSLTRDDAGNSKLVPFDTWSMHELENGTFLVKMSLVLPASASGDPKNGITQNVTYDDDLIPTSFTLIDSRRGPDSKSMEIRCHYFPSKLECFVGQPGKVYRPESINYTRPFAFLPFPLLTIDLPWFYRDIVSWSPRVIGKRTLVPLIAFSTAENASESSLELVETDAVEYLGEESIQIANQSVSAHKFRTWDAATGPATFTDVWLSHSGLVLKFGQNGNTDFLLSKYSGPSL
jgi:hypothetical protein